MAPIPSDDTPPRFLLLLPLASSLTWEAFQSDFGETIVDVLREVALQSKDFKTAPILDIALACTHLTKSGSTKPYSNYGTTQTAVALAYRLVVVTATREHINIEDAEGVDARVLLIAWDTDASSPAASHLQAPVVSLSQLATASQRWQFAFGVESDSGEAMFKAFLQAKGSPGASAPSQSVTGTAPQTSRPSHNACVAVGGTFDHLHIGHKLLLTLTVFAAIDHGAATDTSVSVIVGITNDALLANKKFAEQLESWPTRQQAVYSFVRGILDFSSTEPSCVEVSKPGPNGHAIDVAFASGLLLRCVEIADPFGPTITEEAVDALIISAETRSGGKAVNDKRAEKGWRALEVLEVDVLDAAEAGGAQPVGEAAEADFAGKISSTEIRRKLHDKQRAVTSAL